MDASQASYFTIGLGCWILACTIAASFLIDRVGRRRMLIYGLFGTAIGNTLTAIVSKMPFDRVAEGYAVVVYLYNPMVANSDAVKVSAQVFG